MLDYTRKAVSKIKKDFDIIKWIMEYGLNILMLIYLTVAIVFSFGNLIVNCTLLIITGLFLIFNIFYGKKELSKKQKKIAKKKRRALNHVLTICKIMVKAFSLGVALYGMYISSKSSPITIILTTLMLLMWCISVIIEIIKLIIDHEKEYLFDSIKQDFKWYYDAKQYIEEKTETVKNNISKTTHAIQDFVENKVEDVKEGIDKAKSAIQKVFSKDNKQIKK